MKTLPQDTFNDLTHRAELWELYGELLDFYNDINFTAKQVAYETGHSKQLINKLLHRLIQKGAVKCTGQDTWQVKYYRLNPSFSPH